MSAAFAIDFYAKDYSRLRTGAGNYVDGRWVDGTPTSVTIRAAVFSPSGRDLYDLPEGQRERIVWTIWSREELRTADEDAQTVADAVQIQGRWFRVFKVWPRVEGDYHKALLERDVERNRSVSSTPPVVDGGDWH